MAATPAAVAPRDPQLTSTTPPSAPVPSPSPAPAFPKSPEQLARARVERDRMRERIYQAFGKPAPEEPAPSATGHAPYAPMPELDGGQIDLAYIRGVIHDDYFPLAQSCYLDLVNRAPDAGGRLSFDFTIVGNPQIGGIVERVDLADGSTIDDPAMVTCMRESMLSMTFAPPPNGGSVTVRYPIDFSPVDDDPVIGRWRLTSATTVVLIWTYESPHPAMAEIKDYVAFDPDRVDSVETI